MSAQAKRRRLRAPSWLAPIILWYEQTMRGLVDHPQTVAEHTTHARHWWRHFEQAGQTPLRPVVLTEHARQRYVERYGGDPNHLDLGSFRFTGERTLCGTLVISNGTAFLVVAREKKCYRARTALTPSMIGHATC